MVDGALSSRGGERAEEEQKLLEAAGRSRPCGRQLLKETRRLQEGRTRNDARTQTREVRVDGCRTVKVLEPVESRGYCYSPAGEHMLQYYC